MRLPWILLLAASAPAFPAEQGDGRPPLPLSLKRAVELATSPEGNTNIRLAGEGLKQAELRSAEARASLLPSVESSFNLQNRTTNLEAMGVRVNVPIAGFQFPTFV